MTAKIIFNYHFYANNTTNSNENIKIKINNQMIQSIFNEIRDIPYNIQSMNCEVKSKLFAEYLYSHGGKQINLVVIEHD